MAAVASGASAQNPLHGVSAVLALSPDHAHAPLKAELRGVVTAIGQGGFFLQDAHAGIWVFAANPESVRPGDSISVEGAVEPGSYSPVVRAAVIRMLGRAALPKPQRTTYAELSSGDLDSQYVSVEGWVRAAGARPTEPNRFWMKLLLPGGTLFLSLPAREAKRAEQLIDSYVRVSAVASCSKNEGRQITSALLVASNLNGAVVLKHAAQDPFARPVVPIGRLMQYRSGTSLNERVKVQGTVTYAKAGEGLVLEGRGHALSVASMQTGVLSLGERIEAVGFPALTPSGPMLEDTLFRSLGSAAPIAPAAVTSDQLATGTFNHTLISLEGKLMRRVFEPGKVELLLQNGESIVLAELALSDAPERLIRLAEGNRVRVTGICVLNVAGPWNLGPQTSYNISYKVLLRNVSDVAVLQAPSWWTTRHLVYVSSLLSIVLLVLLVFGIHGRAQHWRLETVMKERERFSHELHDSLAQGFAGLGFQLQAIRRAVPDTMPELRAQVELATKLAQYSHKQARESIEPMLPSVERNGDLLRSLQETAQQLTAGGNVQIRASCLGKVTRLPPGVLDTLQRIGQEAIANVVRHAKASEIGITVEYLTGAVRLTLCDNGCGFVKSGSLLGFGLHGMRKRAAAIDAEIAIESQLGAGASVSVLAPLPKQNLISQALETLRTKQWSGLHASRN